MLFFNLQVLALANGRMSGIGGTFTSATLGVRTSDIGEAKSL